MKNERRYKVQFVCPNPIKDNGWWQLMRTRDNAILFAGSYNALQNEIIERGIADDVYFV